MIRDLKGASAPFLVQAHSILRAALTRAKLEYTGHFVMPNAMTTKGQQRSIEPTISNTPFACKAESNL
jgi:hypothetical protein